MFTKKHFIIIIVISFFLGISWAGPGSPAYDNKYEKVWDSGNILPNPVYTAAVCDLDLDGKPEIIVSDNSKTYDGKIFIFENSGNDSFQLVWNSGGIITGNDCYIGIAVGDLDKDGKREIITLDHQPLSGNTKVYVLENTGDNTYQLVWDSGDTLFGEDGASVFTGDADSDGKFEIIVGTGWGHANKGKIYVFENTGNDAYEAVWNSGSALSDTVLPGAVGDLDKDGKKEIIVGSGDIDPQIHVFENTGDNSYALVWDSGSFFNRQMRITIGDADNDGKEEIIAGSVDKLVCVFENAGDNSYQLAWISPGMPHYMHFVSVGDQDNDGKKEIIAPCQDNVVYLFENTGDDTFEIVWNSGNLLGGTACQTVPGDADGDGKGEIIVPCYDKKVYVFEGKQTPATTLEIVEDFSVCNSDWVEYDPKNKIEIDCTDDHRLEFNHWIRYEPGYVYRPFSTQDFVLEYDIDITDDGGNANIIGPGFSDIPGTMDAIQNGVYTVYYAGFGGPQIDITTFVNGSVEWSWGGWGEIPNRIWINTNTTYYVRFEKNGNTLKLSIFSDPDRTIHISGSPKTITTNLSSTTFNYFYAVTGYLHPPQGNWEWTGGWIDNIYVRTEQGQNQPPVVDAGLDQIVEQETCEGTEVTQTGHVSDSDGDALTYQWKEGETVLASGTVPAPNGPPTDTDVTLVHIFPPGEHIVTLTVSDGETSSSDDVSIIVHDTVPPFSMLTTIPVAPDGLDGWFKSAVQATITAEDNGSGVKEIYYKKDSGTVFTIVQGDHAVFYPGDGTYTIEYYAKDKAGNEESFHNTYNFNVDTAAPVTAAAVHGNGSGNTYINHAAILLKASDAASGVKEIHYIINGSETVVPNANATINLNQAGTYTIQYRASDNAGNQETHHSLQLEIISPRSGIIVIKNIIASLPNTGFAKNAQNRKNALLNKLDQVIAAIDSGQYPDAIDKLVNDIGKKTDGCVTFGAADKNDWIVDCQAQSRLNTWINILVAGLSEMMNG